MARVVVVSNRVPAPARNVERAGGLEVALQGVFRKHQGMWFGWSGRVVEEGGKIETRTFTMDAHQYIVRDLTKEDMEEYYNGFANRVLWPILHYRLDLAEYSLRDLSGYLRVNQYFADELSKVVLPDDVIWIHDYHLIPLGAALRKHGIRNKIGFFLHIPLPPPEILTALPNHETLFGCSAAYDLIGFQTETDKLNFARYLINECKLATRDLETFLADGRAMRIGVYPVGVDVAEIAGWAQQGIRSKLARELQASLVGRSLIIGVDRLDYSKGIPERMQSFEIFLQRHPEWEDKVTYVQITPRSRSKIREYAEMEASLNESVGKINGRYGGVTWTPIRYVNKSYSRPSLAALYRLARVGLVTPLRDGMNLVAKEYVAAQNSEDPGVLVLSRFAGAARDAEGAIIVNPHDTESVADAIHQALVMPFEERRARHATLLEAMKSNDVEFWGERFLDDLQTHDNEMAMFAGRAYAS